MSTDKATVAVFGATGHTGRFIVSELVRRGLKVIASARDPEKLAATVFPSNNVVRRIATIDDSPSLDRALEGAQAVINCAGPFIDTVDALGGAALRAKIHYLDICAEQLAAIKTLETFDEPARAAGVVFIPSVAFYGGLPDLLATAAAGQWDSVDAVEILIGLDSWHPTAGTRITIGKIGTPQVHRGGSLVPVPSTPARGAWHFGPMLGEQALVEVPFSEMVLIPRHLNTPNVHTYLNKVAVGEVLDAATPEPKAADESGRSEQRFIVQVEVRRGNDSRRATLEGQDIYAISAPLIAEAVERLLAGKYNAAGAFAPSEVFDAKEFLTNFDSGASKFTLSGPRAKVTRI